MTDGYETGKLVSVGFGPKDRNVLAHRYQFRNQVGFPRPGTPDYPDVLTLPPPDREVSVRHSQSFRSRQ
jgi:hypothetical protein